MNSGWGDNGRTEGIVEFFVERADGGILQLLAAGRLDEAVQGALEDEKRGRVRPL